MLNIISFAFSLCPSAGSSTYSRPQSLILQSLFQLIPTCRIHLPLLIVMIHYHRTKSNYSLVSNAMFVLYRDFEMARLGVLKHVGLSLYSNENCMKCDISIIRVFVCLEFKRRLQVTFIAHEQNFSINFYII